MPGRELDADTRRGNIVGGNWLREPLAGDAGLVTVTDGHPEALSWIGGVLGHRVKPLRVEHFGQSGSLPDLFRHYRIDADAIVDAGAAACGPCRRRWSSLPDRCLSRTPIRLRSGVPRAAGAPPRKSVLQAFSRPVFLATTMASAQSWRTTNIMPRVSNVPVAATRPRYKTACQQSSASTVIAPVSMLL